jgi:hypothetical protein
MAVDCASKTFRQGDRGALGFAGHVAESIDERVVGAMEDVRGRFYGGVKRRRLSSDHCCRIIAFRRMTGEPGLSQAARMLCFNDAISLDVELDVIAGAATKSANYMRDNLHPSFLLDTCSMCFRVPSSGFSVESF